jgi:hypothetical protein
MTIGIAEPGRTVPTVVRRVAVCEVQVARCTGAREENGARCES